MAFGVTTTGFNRKRIADIKTEIEESLKANLGKNINLLPEGVLGQLVGIFSDREASIWEELEAVYGSYYPDTAEGVNLDRVGNIVGATRLAATKSFISNEKVVLFGTPGTLIPVGSEISVDGNTSAIFETLANATLIAGTDEIQDLGYSADADSGSFDWNFDEKLITIAAADDAAAIQVKLDAVFGADIIQVTGSQTSSTGLTFEFTGDDADGYGKRDVALATISNNVLLDSGAGAITLTPSEDTAGVPQGAVNVQATETGPISANAGTLSVIDTPVSGWDAVTNLLDATIGTDIETDAEFRVRREQQVARAGAATRDAIRADVLAVEDVITAVVFSNRLDIYDLDGRPPHSVDVVVQGGDNDAIAEALFDSVADGITYVGDISVSVTDSQGFLNTVKFSRPSEVDIYIEIDVVTDAELYPVDGDDQVEAAILAYANELEVGQDVVVHGSDPSVECSLNTVPGIVDITIRVGKTVSPTVDDNVDIEPREVAIFDSTRITVASS